MADIPTELEKILQKAFEQIQDSASATRLGFDAPDMRWVLEAIQNLVTEARIETAKAYGGCEKCYGKGYSTVKTQHTGYGTDGDIGGFEGKYKRDIPISMKYCTCERGKQLATLKKGTSDD